MYYIWEAISQVYTWITILYYNNKSFTNSKKEKRKKKNHLQKICSNKSKREKISQQFPS